MKTNFKSTSPLPTYSQAVKNGYQTVIKHNRYYIDYNVPATKTSLCIMVGLGILYIVILNCIIVNESFAQLYLTNSWLANFSLCGVFGMILGFFKCISILWSHFSIVENSKYFAIYSQFLSIFFIIYSFYCVSVTILMARGFPRIIYAWLYTHLGFIQ